MSKATLLWEPSPSPSPIQASTITRYARWLAQATRSCSDLWQWRPWLPGQVLRDVAAMLDRQR